MTCADVVRKFAEARPRRRAEPADTGRIGQRTSAISAAHTPPIIV